MSISTHQGHGQATRFIAVFGGLVAVWIVAHLLSIGPVQAATEVVLAWLAGLTAVSALIAAVTVLAWGMAMRRTTLLWLRFVGFARTATAAIGTGLVLVGMLHYRDTEPRGDIAWLVVGLALLAGALAVHAWLTFAERRYLR